LSLVALVALVTEVIVSLLVLTLDSPRVRVVSLSLNKVKGLLLNKVKGGELAKEEIIEARRLRETLTILARRPLIYLTRKEMFSKSIATFSLCSFFKSTILAS